MQLNKTLLIGENYIARVKETLIANGISGKILYVSDSIVDVLYGDIVRKQIEEVGILKTELVDDNTISYSMNLAERVIATSIKCIVALGGGRVLDVCKYASYISKVPLLSIPTTMANDGIASPIAVLKRQDNKPMSLGSSMPTMLLIDTKIILDSPIELVKAGIGDTISNYMALIDWEHAVEIGKDTMNGYAFMMSQTSLDALMNTQFNTICPGFIKLLANCLVLSGIAMDFAGTSRPVSGSEHLFSHALDYYCPKRNLHGIQVALGTVAVLRLINRDYRPVLEYLNKFKVDINPSHLGIDEETFVLCMQKATSMRTGRYTYLEEIDLSDKTLQSLYKELVKEL